MSGFKHCEFRHLMRLSEWRGHRYWSHVHEGEALHCAVMVNMGWPDPTAA